MSKTLYFYSNPSDKGRVAIAGIVKDRKIYLGFAHCSPNDQFLKKRAREISYGRAEKALVKKEQLNDNQYILTISSKESPAQQFNEFCTFICKTKQYDV